jgi:salicylate hydroxylase
MACDVLIQPDRPGQVETTLYRFFIYSKFQHILDRSYRCNSNMGGKEITSVAIVGGGPGGLGTAIALSQLPFIRVTLYEKNPEPREAGAGLSLSTNAWKVLDLLGASDIVRGGSKSNTHHRQVLLPELLCLLPISDNT